MYDKLFIPSRLWSQFPEIISRGNYGLYLSAYRLASMTILPYNYLGQKNFIFQFIPAINNPWLLRACFYFYAGRHSVLADILC